MSDTTQVVAQTPEQIAAEAARVAAEKAAAADAAKKAKVEAKAKADAAKAEAKAAADLAKSEAKAKADAAKAEAKAKKDTEIAAAKKAKEDAAAAKAAEKAKQAAEAGATKVRVVQPSQNGVTRPRPDGECGKVWALADTISARIGQPTPISMLLAEATPAGLNEATTKTQYARWKTFNGVFGQVPKPAVAPVVAAEPVAAAV